MYTLRLDKKEKSRTMLHKVNLFPIFFGIKYFNYWFNAMIIYNPELII